MLFNSVIPHRVEAETTEGTISFHDWLGDSWGVRCSRPSESPSPLSTSF
jgi:alkyl hydroperoxide reductase subunit AhpC